MFFYEFTPTFFAFATILFTMALAVLFGYAQKLYRRFLAWDTNRLGNMINNVKEIAPLKKDLFSSMADTIKTVGGPILEVGVGGGACLQFYPEGTKLIAVDLNENFKPYLLENLQNNRNVTLQEFVVGNAEDMKKDIPDNSCSCVVSSLLLCSVDQQKVLAEVMRILKPGGRFYFIEHLVAEPGTFVYWFQYFFEPLWRFIREDCHLMRKTDELIGKFGFENVDIKTFSPSLSMIFFFVNRWCGGSASKPLK